jgi:hypothetical protein
MNRRNTKLYISQQGEKDLELISICIIVIRDACFHAEVLSITSEIEN